MRIAGEITNRDQQFATYQRVDLGEGIGLDLVLVPGGSFIMGSPAHEPILGNVSGYPRDLFNNERPQHLVTLADVWMGKYPVTQAQYQRLMGENPSQFKGDNRPVEQVNWDEAMEFCDRLSDHTGQTHTLPSEVQWEYACRAGTSTPFHHGETTTPNLANYGADLAYGDGPTGIYRKTTTPVGSFPPNAFGLYDMHGNVWEWCLDLYHENYEGAPTDGSAWVTGGDPDYRIIRGGSWYCYPHFCRSASRDHDLRDVHLSNFGFRVVAS